MGIWGVELDEKESDEDTEESDVGVTGSGEDSEGWLCGSAEVGGESQGKVEEEGVTQIST